MKQLAYFLVCIITINTSCTKTAQGVHFHGRITLDCNNQIPVKNVMLSITRVYDTGVHQYDAVGNIVTDNNGYYSLITDVKQPGGFMYYVFNFNTNNVSSATSSPEFYGGARSYDNDKDIEVNVFAERSKAYKFHIKNVSPVNSGDILNSLIVSHLNYNNQPLVDFTNISNLAGTNVDTIIYQFYSNYSANSYKYSYIKNGILTSVPYDTLAVPNCLDTATVNVFY